MIGVNDNSPPLALNLPQLGLCALATTGNGVDLVAGGVVHAPIVTVRGMRASSGKMNEVSTGHAATLYRLVMNGAVAVHNVDQRA